MTILTGDAVAAQMRASVQVATASDDDAALAVLASEIPRCSVAIITSRLRADHFFTLCLPCAAAAGAPLTLYNKGEWQDHE